MNYTKNGDGFKRLAESIILRVIQDYYCHAVQKGTWDSCAEGSTCKKWVTKRDGNFDLICGWCGKEPEAMQTMILQKMKRIDHGEDLKIA